jgi:hypothetical protein
MGDVAVAASIAFPAAVDNNRTDDDEIEATALGR